MFLALLGVLFYCMKRYLNLRLLFGFCLVLSLILAHPFAAFSDVNQLMINTGSNALMTLELDDSDYLMMSPRSSFGTVSNTIDSNTINVDFRVTDENGNHKYGTSVATLVNGRYELDINLDGNSSWTSKSYVTGIYPYLYKGQMPPSGSYAFSFDYSSDISYGYSGTQFRFRKKVNNASWTDKYVDCSAQRGSGDLYLAPYNMNLTNLDMFYFNMHIPYSEKVRLVAGSFAINFKPIESGDYLSTSVNDTSVSDYQSDVSDSLSDLSSSVDEVSDEIGFVAEAIQNLQGAMEPHYNNVLTQLHHITEQLHAFYDQIYNNIHLKEYALWQDIKTAIENIDLEVNVNLDKLKTSIDNMSQAVQNKLQSVTDTITGGYNNSGMQEDNNELSGALDELDNAEQEVLDDVNGYIEGFEYPSFDGISSGIIGALSFFGGFLHSIFLGMGEFGLIITFSLTMIFVLIIVGYHRIRS